MRGWAVRIPLAVWLAGCGASASPAGPWTGGIGATLRYSKSRGTLIVDSVPRGTPAARAELERGDRITEIEGETVQGLDEAAIVGRLRGPVGTKVRLSVERGSRTMQIEVERAPYR